MSKVICDQAAFMPFRALVTGPFHNLGDLAEAECLFRALVLHDQIVLQLPPKTRGPDAETKTKVEVPSSFLIEFMGPNKEFDYPGDFGVFTADSGESLSLTHRAVNLSPSLVELVTHHTKAGPGDTYFDACVDYLQRIVHIELQGGSAVVVNELGSKALQVAQKFPEKLFSDLDVEWQSHARAIHENGFGLLVPPVLGIVLSRCEKRTDIPRVLRELREEWAVPRTKVWKTILALRDSKTLGEMSECERELTEASKFFLPSNEIVLKDKAVRTLWDITTGIAIGATVGALSQSATIGAMTGLIKSAGDSIGESLREYGKCLIGRGAFDLANKVRLGAREVDPLILSKILSDSEKAKLGIG
jgi:hypothetical protein